MHAASIADLIGKAAHIRTVPVPGWVKAAIDGWTMAAEITTAVVPLHQPKGHDLG